jgi:hypothetical protein
MSNRGKVVLVEILGTISDGVKCYPWTSTPLHLVPKSHQITRNFCS